MPARFYLDTNVIISIIDGVETLETKQVEFISHIEENKIEALTSELTLAECLVRPLADKNISAIKAYMGFLEGRPDFAVIPVSRDILILAAQVRVDTRLKLPDAIHAATAKTSDCAIFLTCDRRIKNLAGLKIVLWDQLGEGDY